MEFKKELRVAFSVYTVMLSVVRFCALSHYFNQSNQYTAPHRQNIKILINTEFTGFYFKTTIDFLISSKILFPLKKV